MKQIKRYKEKIIISIFGYVASAVLIPYFVDVTKDQVHNYLNYINPVILFNFYRDKIFILAGLVLLVVLLLVIFDGKSNDMVIEHEDVARLATLEEIKKNFKRLKIEGEDFDDPKET